MDRQITHTGALIPNATLLGGEKAKLIALGHALDAVLGGSTCVGGLSCTPTSPASLSVVIGPGSIMTKTAVDATAFGDLGTDTTAVVKQGILAQALTLPAVTPPNASGYSQVFLVQAAQADQDSGTVLPYYNAANPAQPFNGPNNSGTQDVTLRTSACVVAFKPGFAAPTGTQQIPAPDPGYVGLYAITLTNGQTQITSANIAIYAGAPFIPVKLPAVPAGVQSGQWLYAADTGSAGALVAALAPTPTTLPDGMEIHVKAANAAIGSDTINVSGLGTLPLQRLGGRGAPAAGDWKQGDILTLRKIGSAWQVAALLPSDVLALVTGSGQVPIIIQSPTLYVRTDGNDATGDGSANTAAKAFATIGAAAAYGKARYYLAGIALTIRLGIPGTYAPSGNVDCGGGTINIVGDTANQANYIVQGPGPAGGASGLIASINGTLNLSGLYLINTSTINSCVAAAGAGTLSITNVTLGTTVAGSPSLIAAYSGGNIAIFAGCIFAGSAGSAMLCSSAYITMAGNIGLANNPNYATAFCYATNGGVWSLSGSFGFSSAAATGTRYLAVGNGIIATNGSGAGFFPGSAAGQTSTGGQYV